MAGTWDNWSLCVQDHETVRLFPGSETRVFLKKNSKKYILMDQNMTKFVTFKIQFGLYYSHFKNCS